MLHAPTDRDAKGTRYVLEAVDRLRGEGLDVELLLIEGMTYADARNAYERADILVDQVLLGWYGGLAVELMALAKPVVAHLRVDDLRVLPAEMCAELPIVDATPDSLADVLRSLLVERRAELPSLGQRGRAYVKRWHEPLRIAQGMRERYEEAVSRSVGRSRRESSRR